MTVTLKTCMPRRQQADEHKTVELRLAQNDGQLHGSLAETAKRVDVIVIDDL